MATNKTFNELPSADTPLVASDGIMVCRDGTTIGKTTIQKLIDLIGSGGSGSVAWGNITGKPTFADVATTGSYTDLLNKPTYATVASTGSYNDLTNKPTIPSAANFQGAGAFVTLTDAASIATNAAAGNNFKVTVAGNRTLANPTNLVEGQRYTWQITQDATGGRFISFDTLFVFQNPNLKYINDAPNGMSNIEALYNGTSLLIESRGLPLPRLAMEARLGFEGDSFEDLENSGQHSQFNLGLLLRGCFYRPQGGNLATGGQTISGSPSTATVISSDVQIASVVAQKLDVLVFMAGTNDINSGITDENIIFTALRRALDGYFAGGTIKYISVSKIAARNYIVDTSWTAVRDKVRLAYNALLETLPALYNGRVFVAQTDADTPYHTIDISAANTSFELDGIHANWRYMDGIGYAQWASLQSVLPLTYPTQNYPNSNNLLTNPALRGTGGGKTGNAGSGVPVPTGNVADSFNAANNMNGIDVVCSKTTLNGAEAQKFVFSGTLATANTNFQFNQTVTVNGAIGEGWEAVSDIVILAGHTNLKSIYTTAGLTSSSSTGVDGVSFDRTVDLKGSIRSKLVTPIASAVTTAKYAVFIQGNAAGVALGATVIIGKPILRKIAATAPL